MKQCQLNHSHVDSDIDSSDDMSISTVLNDQHTDAGMYVCFVSVRQSFL